VEGLEDRRLMSSSTLPDVAMISAATADSKSITFVYDVKNADVTQPLQFGFYRSPDNAYHAGDPQVGSVTIVPVGSAQIGVTLDASGQPADAPGRHTITVGLPAGLPLNPMNPYVLAVADPGNAVNLATRTDTTASFHTDVIGVITHGGVQPTKWARTGPPWERRMAEQLLGEGYNTVIPYNWVSDSNHPGRAIEQGPRLAAKIAQAASQFPAGDVVDIHFIGHSEGTVINSQTILRLNQTGWPDSMKAGYIKVTMLDPHAANNGIPGQQYSVSGGFLGFIARQEINGFQYQAKDPLPVVPANVNDAEVFFQRTAANKAESNNGVYNLWGQVPLHGEAHYYDLTAEGISHSGKFGVQDWYRLNVVPTLGDGETYINTAKLIGEGVNIETSPSGRRETVTYTGTAAPDATVRLFAAKPKQKDLTPIGRTTVNTDGTWVATTYPLPEGEYRVVAVSHVHAAPGQHPLFFRPTAWLGKVSLTRPPR
jgi:hypothetical protein